MAVRFALGVVLVLTVACHDAPAAPPLLPFPPDIELPPDGPPRVPPDSLIARGVVR